MNILVTGGIGRIGRYTVAHLLELGYRVRILDLEIKSEISSKILNLIEGADYQEVDITKYSVLTPHFDGIDAVVHLAAIPYPAPGRDVEIFNTNCIGTFNVYHAAARSDVKKVVSASSINALGNNFGIRRIPIQYFPIDEDHPSWTSDVYSFSKQVLEDTAGYFWRRESISSICMRLPWVFDPAWMAAVETGNRLERIQEEFQMFKTLSNTERQAAEQSVHDQFQALRKMQVQGEIEHDDMVQQMHDIPYRALFFGRKDFWAILDVRDAAHAIHQALIADLDGCHVLNIADSSNAVGLPTADLAAMFYPEVTAWKREVFGSETLFSIDKASELIGFAPQHSISRFS